MENKREWQKPQLVILGRGTQEEQVLATCKTTTVPSAPGPNTKTCAEAPNHCRNGNIS